jgi:hypothetical protein
MARHGPKLVALALIVGLILGGIIGFMVGHDDNSSMAQLTLAHQRALADLLVAHRIAAEAETKASVAEGDLEALRKDRDRLQSELDQEIRRMISPATSSALPGGDALSSARR